MPNAASPDGLIHALLLDGRGGKTDVTWNSIDEWEPGQGCLWLHLNFEDPEDMISLRVWTDGHRVISTRRRKLVSIRDVVSELDAG